MKKKSLIALGLLILLLAILGHALTYLHPVRDPQYPRETKNLSASQPAPFAHPAIS